MVSMRFASVRIDSLSTCGAILVCAPRIIYYIGIDLGRWHMETVCSNVKVDTRDRRAPTRAPWQLPAGCWGSASAVAVEIEETDLLVIVVAR